MERSKAGMKKSLNGLSKPYYNTIIINIIFKKIWKKYNDIQLTKTKWTWKSKYEKSSTLPRSNLTMRLIITITYVSAYSLTITYVSAYSLTIIYVSANLLTITYVSDYSHLRVGKINQQ